MVSCNVENLKERKKERAKIAQSNKANQSLGMSKIEYPLIHLGQTTKYLYMSYFV